MFRPFITIIVVLTAITGAFPDTLKNNEAMFFAGVTLLQLKTDLTSDEKALKFKDLETLTGISAAEAKTLLDRYRNKPAEWQKLYGTMMKLLNDTKLEFQKIDSIQTANKDTSKTESLKSGKKPFVGPVKSEKKPFVGPINKR